MKLLMLLGTLIGFTVVFVVSGFWKGDFDWSWWIAMLIGGTIGHLAVAYLVPKFPKKRIETAIISNISMAFAMFLFVIDFDTVRIDFFIFTPLIIGTWVGFKLGGGLGISNL